MRTATHATHIALAGLLLASLPAAVQAQIAPTASPTNPSGVTARPPVDSVTPAPINRPSTQTNSPAVIVPTDPPVIPPLQPANPPNPAVNAPILNSPAGNIGAPIDPGRGSTSSGVNGNINNNPSSIGIPSGAPSNRNPDSRVGASSTLSTPGTADPCAPPASVPKTVNSADGRSTLIVDCKR
jgi:hypothetical protein